MLAEEVVALIKKDFPDAEVHIEGEDCSFSATVISERFSKMSLLKKQQSVLATVKEQIASGELHAMTVSALTPQEWEKKQLSSSASGLTSL